MDFYGRHEVSVLFNTESLYNTTVLSLLALHLTYHSSAQRTTELPDKSNMTTRNNVFLLFQTDCC
jgi:hypothetical protein